MRIGILGANGRLGSLIVRLLEEQNISFFKISKEIILKRSLLSKLIMDSTTDVILLDVSLAAGTAQFCYQIKELESTCIQKIRGFVIGTTGHTELEKELIREVSQYVPLCLASNFSKGIFLFEQILQAQTKYGLNVSQLAKKLGFDLALQDVHHTEKKDAPSGTSLSLAHYAQLTFDKISSLRVGKVAGEHSLYLSAPSEDLKVIHTAHSRMLFAEGALALCKNIYNKSPGCGFLNKEDFFI